MQAAGAYADLELRILQTPEGALGVEMTLNGEQEFPRGRLDPAFLDNWSPSGSAAQDGEQLFAWLQADPDLRSAWDQVRGQHPQRRIRLRIDADVPQLHLLPWELLRDPGTTGQTASILAATAATPFSRYLAGTWQPGSPILQRPIKVLVAMASPTDLEQRFQLAPVDIDQEWKLLQDACQDLEDLVQLTLLPQPCTLTALEDALHQGYHVLHLVSHGTISERTGDAALLLANAENLADLARDQEIADMLARQLADSERRQDDKLRLVFLAACQSATRSAADAFRGLAPKLVAAGVPAVLAMQDKVPVVTAQAFAATFYRQILQHGLVDLAANQARSSILTADLPGAAIPVLFMRLRGGRLFGERGQILGDRADSFWNTLLENIADGECTPFLGPGITAGLLPTPVELAQSLATQYNYPFPNTESLPRVAQFVGTMDNRRLRKETVRALAEGFQRRMGLRSRPEDRSKGLSQIISESDWSTHSRQLLESEIHHQLAALNLPIYISTNLDNFMALALRDKGRQVREETVKWRETISRDASRPHWDLEPPPSAEAPLVLHLFGTDDDLLSMVLTEDDYMDYLARISRDYEYLLPTSVNEALASTTLLFLGFRLQDLDLRVIMRGLLTNLDLERWGMLHVAVQIESSVADQTLQEEVTRYFQKYFAISKIDVYWGSTQQFVADLHARWQEFGHA